MKKFLYFIWVVLIIYISITSILFVVIAIFGGQGLSTGFYYYLLPALVVAFMIAVGSYIHNNRLLHLESEKEKKYKKLLEKEKEEKERNTRIKLEKKIPEKLNALKTLSAIRLEELKLSFLKVTENITKEENDLIGLKKRHKKIESIVTSRKLGDSQSDQVKKIQELFEKLESQQSLN